MPRPSRTADPASAGPDPAAHLANVLGVVALDVVTSFARAVEAASGLSLVQATALSALANSLEGGSIDRLARVVDLSHSATVRLVDRLAERGLVTRGAGADGRVSALHLTAAGRRTARAAQDARHSVLAGVVDAVAPGRRAALGAVLDGLAARDVTPAPVGVARADRLCRLCDAHACGHPVGCPVTRAVCG